MLNMTRRIPFVLAIVPFDAYDKPKITKDHGARSFYDETSKYQTGWDRLHNMYSTDDFGNKSPEMNFVLQGTCAAVIGGAVWGGIAKSKGVYFEFIRKNDASKYTSILEAQKKLQDAVTVNFAKGAFQYGWRLGLFTGSFILITTSISTYRGKSSIIEYTTAGFISGSCYKFSLGPRAMLVGGLLGGVLGSVAGLMSLGLLKLSGTTMEEIRFWQYNWKKSRDVQIQGSLKRACDEDTPWEKYHDGKLKNTTELLPDITPDIKTESKEA